jgi:hypothetical protein
MSAKLSKELAPRHCENQSCELHSTPHVQRARFSRSRHRGADKCRTIDEENSCNDVDVVTGGARNRALRPAFAD